MPGGLKQPAKGFKLARGTTLQKPSTAKKEAIKFRLLTVFETKTLFVVRNGSCHKNLSGNFIWDNCMSSGWGPNADSGRQNSTEWAAYAGCWSALWKGKTQRPERELRTYQVKHKAWENTGAGKHCLFTSPRTTGKVNRQRTRGDRC